MTSALSDQSGSSAVSLTPATRADNSDPYLYVGPPSGRWNDGANWQNQTTGDTGSVPTLHNAVTFGVDTPEQQTQANDTVTGIGQSASLGLYGSLTLAGRFNTGALNLLLFYQPAGFEYFSASLTVTGAGNSLRAGSAHAAGNLLVNKGATMTVARGYEIASGRPLGNDPHYELDGLAVDGAGSRVTIGGLLSTHDASDLFVTDGGYLQARSMTLDNTYGIAGYQVDAQSTIEVGQAGNAAVGTWTIDQGSILTIGNAVRLSAPEFVINGLIVDKGGLNLQGAPGDVTGSGKIRIDAGALLTMGYGGAQLNIMFRGDSAELDLTAVAAFGSRIWGFAAGNSISVADRTFDSATWQRGALDLFSGTTLVGRLKVAGSYQGDTFSVTDNVITVEAASGASSATESRQADSLHNSTAQRSLQLFMQEMASTGREGAALHDLSTQEPQYTLHPMLAAATLPNANTHS